MSIHRIEEFYRQNSQGRLEILTLTPGMKKLVMLAIF